MRITECASDSKFWGIYFTLDEPQEVLLGWQADLLNSSATQEFRVEKVKLAAYTPISPDPEPDTSVTNMEQGAATPTVYTLQGVHVATPLQALPRGIYIVDEKKHIVR